MKAGATAYFAPSAEAQGRNKARSQKAFAARKAPVSEGGRYDDAEYD
jgi:hypothetical protein